MAGTQQLTPQYVVDASCTACGACLLTCPTAAFVVGLPLTVDPARCTDCGACVEVCPADAVTRLPGTDRAPASDPAASDRAANPSAIFRTWSSKTACRQQDEEDRRAGGAAGEGGVVRGAGAGAARAAAAVGVPA